MKRSGNQFFMEDVGNGCTSGTFCTLGLIYQVKVLEVQ